MFFHVFSLALNFLPYIPSLVLHIFKNFLSSFLSAFVSTSLGLLGFYTPYLSPLARCRFSPFPLSRFVSLLRRFAAFTIFFGPWSVRLFPDSLRPAPCALFFFFALIFLLSSYAQSTQAAF